MNKFTQVAVAAGLAVAFSSAFAGGYTRAEMPAHDCGVTGLGVSLFSTIGDSGYTVTSNNKGNQSGGQGFIDFGHNINLGLNYVVNPWEMGLSFGGITSTADNTYNTHYDLGMFFGHRWALFHCLFGSVGVQGDYEHTHSAVSTYTDTYNAGAYLGLSYEPTQHFAVFTRIDAVNWNGFYPAPSASQGGHSSNLNFFDRGVFGLSYYFGDVM